MRTNKSKKTSTKAGLPPGTLIHVGETYDKITQMELIYFNQNELFEKEIKTVEELISIDYSNYITWLNVDNLTQVDIIEKIGKHFNLHSLVMEDILNTHQRPKYEIFDDYLYIVLKAHHINSTNDAIISEQVSMILGKNYVITFQEDSVNDPFKAIRDRIRNNKGRIRKETQDYLFYALLDNIVDSYYFVMDMMNERNQHIEDQLLEDFNNDLLKEINNFKKDVLFLRRTILPLRDVISAILKPGEIDQINPHTLLYLKDVNDHVIQISDQIYFLREVYAEMFNIYQSNLSIRMNQVVKVLTVISTIFIPLTFLAGVYGMNFKFMPELDTPWAYPLTISIMVISALIMVIYFKRKKWI